VKWLPFLACYLIPRGRGFFFLFSLSFSSLGVSFFGCFSALLVLSDASSFFCFLARFMLLGSFFTWVYFLLEPFFFFAILCLPPRRGLGF
jgi:hypothetical protein